MNGKIKETAGRFNTGSILSGCERLAPTHFWESRQSKHGCLRLLKKHFRSGASKAGANTMIHQVKAACLSPEEHFLKTVKERRLLEEINRLDENLPGDCQPPHLRKSACSQAKPKTMPWWGFTGRRSSFSKWRGMMKDKERSIFEDLLPLYHEGLLSKETAEWIEEAAENDEEAFQKLLKMSKALLRRNISSRLFMKGKCLKESIESSPCTS